VTRDPGRPRGTASSSTSALTASPGCPSPTVSSSAVARSSSPCPARSLVARYRDGADANDLLVEAARWLPGFHDATTDLPRRDERWQLPDHSHDEIICHNDFAPYNMVFGAEHRLVGAIDFDTCSPCSRVWDLASLAYRMVPFHVPGTLQTPTMDAGQRIDRLELLCDSYGPPAQPDDILAMLEDRVRDLYDFTAVRAAAAGPASELHSLPLYEVDLATCPSSRLSGNARWCYPAECVRLRS
jgi:hypothetical protein